MTNILYVAWRSPGPTGGRWGPIGRLEHDAGVYRFRYTRGARTLAGFQPFPEMPQLDAIYECDELFPLFSNRLLSRSRSEYRDYLAWGGFDPDHPPEPIPLLAVTGGRRATDQIEVFPSPSPDADGRYVNTFFLHGIRQMPAAAQSRIIALESGERLLAEPEDNNPSDANAVAVFTEGDHVHIGYVPRYLASDVRELYRQSDSPSVELKVNRVNEGSPLQQRLLCRMEASWPEGFRPCSGEAFEPIVSDSPATAS